MQLGMIGLARMRANMVRGLTQGGHECVVYEVHAQAVEKLWCPSIVGASSLEDLVARRAKPLRGLVDGARGGGGSRLTMLVPLLEAGDIVSGDRVGSRPQCCSL